jgi:hypothetical protein
MGERRAHTDNRSNDINCRWPYRVALMLGRTLVGERIWDISRCIDALENFPECDMDKIFITGNSGGGTISYYSACLEDRIKFSAPSCAVCPYADSILALAHCGCNYLPNAYRNFEMQDLAQVSQEVAKVVHGLKVGEISDAFTMVNLKGKEICAIVKLKARIDGHKATIAEDYQRLKSIVQERLGEEKLEKWIREKQKNTYVRINENWVKCDFKYPGWIRQ